METLNSVWAGYKSNWIPAVILGVGGYFIVKKGIKSDKMWALAAGVIAGSLVGSTISIKGMPKVISTSSAPVTKP